MPYPIRKSLAIILTLLCALGIYSCKNSEKQIDKLGIAKNFYHALDQSDHSSIAELLTDSLRTVEADYNYEQTFSQNDYIEWVKWDAVFEPTYEILEMEQVSEMVKAKISKIDKRILFLHEGPIVTSEVLRFHNDKIVGIERSDVIFNDSLFVKNRTDFLNWIEQYHSEWNGVIYDQTEKGGMNYLKAIELYLNEK